MSEPEGFLSRWTRLKHEAGETPEAAAPDEPSGESSAEAPRATPESVGSPAPAEEPGVDLSALPSIESITATTDIRGFLAPGVPAELTRAALRRAWVADPKIRDFIGIAENQWDFTAPDAIPGFGPLGPLDDVRRLVAQVMGEGDKRPDELAGPADAGNSPEMAVGGESMPAASSELNAAADEIATAADEQSVLAALPAPDVQCSETASAAHKDDVDGIATEAPVRRTHGGALPK